MPTGRGAAKAFRIATAACKDKGHVNFKAGSAGDQCRKAAAEAIARKDRK